MHRRDVKLPKHHLKENKEKVEKTPITLCENNLC